MSVPMDTTKEDIFLWVEWMIKEREKQNMSQADLAKKSGLTRTAISDYENRQRVKPDVNALARISEALGYPADYLPRLAWKSLLPTPMSEFATKVNHQTRDFTDLEKEELLAFIRTKNNLRKK
jgi:transcriptional regulator with XRE-family HTH domain